MSHVVVLVGTSKGAFFFHTDEHRQHWRMTGPHLSGWEVASLYGDNRGRVFAGTSHFVYGTTIRMSDDLGESWNEITTSPAYNPQRGFELRRIWQITPGHASQPAVMYAGVEEAGLFVSRDHGETWNEIESLADHPTRSSWFPGGGGMCLHTILVDPSNAKRMWVAASAIGAFRTTDGGKSWDLCTNGLPAVPTGMEDVGVGRCVHKMVQDPRNPDTLYMQFHGGVFRSDDAGDNWRTIEHGLPGNFGFPMVIAPSGDIFVIPLQSDEQRVAPDGELRVYRSQDGGKSWAPVGSKLDQQPQFVGVLRDSMAVDMLEPTGIYVGTSMGNLFFSPDTGETWQQLPGTLPRITTVKTWLME